MQVLDVMLADPTLGKHLKAPSISYGATNLYAHGIFEQETKSNLGKRISELVPDMPAILTVNDKKLHAPMRVQLKYGSEDMKS